MENNLKYNIIYNNDCNFTTGNHVFRAFQKLGLNVKFSRPENVVLDCDKYLYVDSGHEFQIKTPKEYTGVYSIDCYQNGMKLYEKGFNTRLHWWEYVADNVSVVFDAFEFGYRWFKERGNKVIYISMGFDEDIYHRIDREKKYDICFVGGRKTDGLRGKILDIVGKNFNLYSPQTSGFGITEAAAESKCFLDIPPMEDDMLGQRFFEGYATMSKMVSMERPTLSYFQSPNCGIYTYNLWDLENSLKKAINTAINDSYSIIKRDLEHLKWTSKVKTIVENL